MVEERFFRRPLPNLLCFFKNFTEKLQRIKWDSMVGLFFSGDVSVVKLDTLDTRMPKHGSPSYQEGQGMTGRRQGQSPCKRFILFFLNVLHIYLKNRFS